MGYFEITHQGGGTDGTDAEAAADFVHTTVQSLAALLLHGVAEQVQLHGQAFGN